MCACVCLRWGEVHSPEETKSRPVGETPVGEAGEVAQARHQARPRGRPGPGREDALGSHRNHHLRQRQDNAGQGEALGGSQPRDVPSGTCLREPAEAQWRPQCRYRHGGLFWGISGGRGFAVAKARRELGGGTELSHSLEVPWPAARRGSQNNLGTVNTFKPGPL